ncbi:unnamed protein product [Oikopleura dioica]|uniref:Folate receptor-like domain-containing protein n=1 Tax=Oikopleura dioica TaxID=34765 RepID=E4Y4T9_OIKDI|nr:unnamed protein product [Oikopleura dioica]
MKIFFLFAVLFASTEANHGKHKKKKNKQSGEAVHFEAKQNYECEWDELTYQGLETCDHENEHHNSRNDEHAEAEHHDLCPSALIKLNVEPQCSSDEVLWHFCAHSCNCDSNLADYPHAMVRKFKCEEFKDILGQIGYPDKLSKPEHIDCEKYAAGMYVNCHCQPDDSKAAMLSLVILGSAFLAFKIGAFFWDKFTKDKRKKNAGKAGKEKEEEESLIN